MMLAHRLAMKGEIMIKRGVFLGDPILISKGRFEGILSNGLKLLVEESYVIFKGFLQGILS